MNSHEERAGKASTCIDRFVKLLKDSQPHQKHSFKDERNDLPNDSQANGIESDANCQDHWTDLVLVPLAQALTSSNVLWRNLVSTYIIESALDNLVSNTHDPKPFEHLFHLVMAQPNNDRTAAIVTLLRHGKRLGVMFGTLKSKVWLEQLELALYHDDMALRGEALTALCTGERANAPPAVFELNWLQQGLWYVGNIYTVFLCKYQVEGNMIIEQIGIFLNNCLYTFSTACDFEV